VKSDLTASAQTPPETSGGYPTETLALIDRAVDVAKEAAHACRSEEGRECFEFALALLRESWIAESLSATSSRPSGGQNARGAEKVIADVKWGLRLIAAVFAREGR
jgi:hypothetical protein